MGWRNCCCLSGNTEWGRGGGYRGESLLGENGVLAKVFKHISLFGPNEWAGLKDVIWDFSSLQRRWQRAVQRGWPLQCTCIKPLRVNKGIAEWRVCTWYEISLPSQSSFWSLSYLIVSPTGVGELRCSISTLLLSTQIFIFVLSNESFTCIPAGGAASMTIDLKNKCSLIQGQLQCTHQAAHHGGFFWPVRQKYFLTSDWSARSGATVVPLTANDPYLYCHIKAVIFLLWALGKIYFCI